MPQNKRGRKPLKKTQKILNAVGRGETDPKRIAKAAGVEVGYVHSTFTRLRKEGRLVGYKEGMRLPSEHVQEKAKG